MTAATGSHDLVMFIHKVFFSYNGSDLRQLFFRLKPARASSGDLFLTKMPVEVVNTQSFLFAFIKLFSSKNCDMFPLVFSSKQITRLITCLGTLEQ